MSLSLSTIITAARDRHAAFHRSRVTDAVLARFLSTYQNELIAKAVIRDRQFMAQRAVVMLALGSDNVPGLAGAGTDGGVPGTSTDGTFATTEASTGSVIEAGVTLADGASVVISETVVTSATSTTLTKTGAGRTVNGDAGRVLVITAGTGLGQRREVVSNTATTWTVAAWETTPDATSMFALVVPALLSDDTAGAVTSLPSTTTTQGYLVKLNAAGVPYIDYADPLMASTEQGVPLPSMQAILPDLCQYWPSDGSSPCPLHVTDAQRRFRPASSPAVYVVGQTLYLCGTSEEWNGITSLEIPYVPLAPTFTALTDLCLLPDHAQPVLVAKAASLMAMRVAGAEDVTIDPAPHHAAAAQAEADFLRAVLLGKRGRSSRIREAW